jgi:protein-S-isoprenylcysteine O-methyltransferase Ste14
MTERKGYKRKKHEDRKDLAGEHPLSDIGQLILFILFLSGLLVDIFILHFSAFFTQAVSIYFRLFLSIPVFILSFILAFSGLKAVFGEKRDELVVIKNNVFSIVRHPIYLGAILLYLGFIIITLSIISFIIWMIIIFYYYLISRYEERLLIDKLGAQYEEYMNDVPMFIPIFFKKKKKL